MLHCKWVAVYAIKEGNPQVKTRGSKMPTEGPDHATRPKRHNSGQG